MVSQLLYRCIIANFRDSICDHHVSLCFLTALVRIRCTERDYRVREDNGTVTVCLQKDVDTLEDLMLNVTARNCDPPDALGRGVNTFTAKIEWLFYITRLDSAIKQSEYKCKLLAGSPNSGKYIAEN